MTHAKTTTMAQFGQPFTHRMLTFFGNMSHSLVFGMGALAMFLAATGVWVWYMLSDAESARRAKSLLTFMAGAMMAVVIVGGAYNAGFRSYAYPGWSATVAHKMAVDASSLVRPTSLDSAAHEAQMAATIVSSALSTSQGTVSARAVRTAVPYKFKVLLAGDLSPACLTYSPAKNTWTSNRGACSNS